MSDFQRATAHALMLDGTEYGPVPVIHADKVRWEHTAHVNNWSAEKNPQTLNAFITWAALKRNGDIDLSYEDFAAQLEVAETRKVEDDKGDKPNPTI